MDRYQRQILLPEIGYNGQKNLQNARVLVIGVGGLSATLLPQLVGAGVGYIRLYDNDHVKLHNLHRQTLFTMQDIGQAKVICAQRLLKKCNPDVKIDAMQELLTPSKLNNALMNINLVIDAADNLAITYPLSNSCYMGKIPFISASILGRQGYVGGFCSSAPSYYSIFPQLPASMSTCNITGVMGPAVAVLGALQAQMALSVLLDLSPSPLGCIINCDCVNWRFSQFRFDSAEEPEQPKIEFIDQDLISSNDYIVDLRSRDEAPISVVKHVHRIAFQELPLWPLPKEKRIVLICASGIRAAQAAVILAQKGYNKLAIIAANYV